MGGNRVHRFALPGSHDLLMNEAKQKHSKPHHRDERERRPRGRDQGPRRERESAPVTDEAAAPETAGVQ